MSKLGSFDVPKCFPELRSKDAQPSSWLATAIFLLQGKLVGWYLEALQTNPSRAEELMTDDEPIVGMYDLLEALEAVIKTADPDKRAALAVTVDGYQESFPEEFFWAVGAQAPTLLYHLMTSIDMSSRPEAELKPRTPVGLVKRKPETS